MPQLNLNQITDKLNSEFVGDTRKLIFWYDDNASFADDIDNLPLDNAKIYHLTKDNQFMTKHLLEREDTSTNYLIYAPFPKPETMHNHLADTIRYSKEFFADRASLIMLDLGIKEKYKDVIERHIKFFDAKERTQKFYDLEIENYNKAVIETGIMSVLCKLKNSSFEDVVRVIITDTELENSVYMAEFEKYGLTVGFWRMCEETFGFGANYEDESSSVLIKKLIYTLFVTYMSKNISVSAPKSLEKFESHKVGNILAFMDSLMNSIIYREDFEKLAEMVCKELSIDNVLKELDVNAIVNLDLFIDVDKYILKWLTNRLCDEYLAAKLGGLSIVEVCRQRRKCHYADRTSSHYHIIENAFHVISSARFEPEKTTKDISKSYIDNDYKIDQRYRFFYYYYDLLEQNSLYEQLVELVENIYTNRFLNPLCVAWSNALVQDKGVIELTPQKDFYKTYIKNSKERVVVIISDALRFEVGQSLMKRLTEDEKCTANIYAMQSVIPSYTRFGMSALLPHSSLEMTPDYEVLVDGKACNNLQAREQILKKYNANSRAVQLDDVRTVKAAKELTTGQEVIYLYHDQIDARGDKSTTENEVFTACEEAVNEIHNTIKRFTSANNTKFIITADHGFVYKRDKLSAGDKIGVMKNSFMGKRYIVTDEPVSGEGVFSIPLSTTLYNGDERIVSLPIGSDIFSVAGGGQNYVHGGASPQEIIIPVIQVKTNKAYTETQNATIALVSLLNKVTNLTVNVDFIQTTAVTDVVKATTYKLFFVSDEQEKISNDNIYVADKKNEDASKRVFRLKFTFKNKQYDINATHYLVAVDEKTGLETLRHEVKMDLAFADDYGFNI